MQEYGLNTAQKIRIGIIQFKYELKKSLFKPTLTWLVAFLIRQVRAAIM